MQYIGLGFLFSLYLFQGLKFVLYDLPREKRREAALKDEVEKVDKQLQMARNRSYVGADVSKAHISKNLSSIEEREEGKE